MKSSESCYHELQDRNGNAIFRQSFFTHPVCSSYDYSYSYQRIIQFYTPISFRKAVKATVVLLPLFGLHWLLTLYRPQNGHCIWLTCYKYLNVALDGLQGLMVAIAFCYRNGEVSFKSLFWSNCWFGVYVKSRTYIWKSTISISILSTL